MDLLKIGTLSASALLFTVSVLPPQSPAKDSGTVKVYKGQPLEYVVRSFAYICCTEVVFALLCHAYILMLNQTDSTQAWKMLPYVCPRGGSALETARGGLSPSFAIGVFFVTAGSLLRLWSYHTLGTLFTFEVVLRDDHRLITTGPYAYMRHPSYTGIAFLLFGVQLMESGRGSYIATCGIDTTPAMWVVRSWQLASLFVVVSLYRRCGVEDAGLEQRFGHSWTKYRQAVPYRLLPYLI